MNEVEEFEAWKSGFSMRDDGPAAFAALKQVAQIKFEIATKEEGWIGRVEEIVR